MAGLSERLSRIERSAVPTGAGRFFLLSGSDGYSDDNVAELMRSEGIELRPDDVAAVLVPVAPAGAAAPRITLQVA